MTIAYKENLATPALFCGAFLFCLAETLLKYLTQTYTAYEIMLYRSVLLIIMIITYASFSNNFDKFRTKKIKTHLLRSFLSSASFILTLKALSGIQIYSFKSLYFLCPLFTAFIGVLFLKETVTKWHILAFLLCIIGILLAFKPNTEIFSIYGVYGLAAALCGSLAILVFKRMASTESTYAIILYYSICSLLIALVSINFSHLTLGHNDIYIFTLISLIHLIASFLFTYGMRSQKLITISLVNYSNLPLSLLLGWVVWRDFPPINMFAASFMIVCGNLILFKNNSFNKT